MIYLEHGGRRYVIDNIHHDTSTHPKVVTSTTIVWDKAYSFHPISSDKARKNKPTKRKL